MEQGAEVILETTGDILLYNQNTTSAAIENDGTLTIKAGQSNFIVKNRSTDAAPLYNTGTLTLQGSNICMATPHSATIGGGGTASFLHPMIEWQFARELQYVTVDWGTANLGISDDFVVRAISATFPEADKPVVLTFKSSSQPVVQQGRDAGNTYTASFIPQAGQLTTYTDVKKCPQLHIVQPIGGRLTVTAAGAPGIPLSDGDFVGTDIVLSLACPADKGYDFECYLSGSSSGDFTNEFTDPAYIMPDDDIWLSARFTGVKPPPPVEPEPEPTVYHTVTLPAVEGAVTDPVAGSYEVEAWSTFRFYLTIDTVYSESQPVITTDRGETLTPRSSDGAYQVKYVRSDVEVFIDGLFPNHPVANESITDPHFAADSALPQIWTEPSALCILFPDGFSATPVRILSSDGRLVDAFQSAPGLSRRQQLPTGVYIVWIGDTVRKVVVGD